MTIHSKVAAFMEQHRMLASGNKILLGLSGGADSVALLCLLCDLLGQEAELVAVHVHHGLRENACRDEAFCRSLCQERGIPFYAERADVAGFSKREHLSLEDAGRRERYRIFHQYREALGCDVIATAHHRDDAAETVLMRILRGCGIDGLKGIVPVREDGVIRPLLCISKQEILDYLKGINQAYVTDETNFSHCYERNRIRNQLIPFLQQEFQWEAIDSLSRLSMLAQEDCAYLEECAAQRFSVLWCKERDGISFPAEALSNEAAAIRSRILRLAYRQLTGEGLAFVHLKALEQLLHNQTGKQISLPGNVVAELSYEKLLIYPVSEGTEGFSYTPSGEEWEQDFPEAGFRIRAERSLIKKEGKQVLSVPVEKSLEIRSRQEGDSMRLPGMGGRKKLKDIFIDKKIPRFQRAFWPLVVCDGEIIWMAGCYKAEYRENGSEYWNITIEKAEE